MHCRSPLNTPFTNHFLKHFNSHSYSMATAVPAQTSDADEHLIWDAILLKTDLALKSNTDPNVWAVQITSTLRSSAVTLPSVDLAHRLVSHLFWNNHSPTAWKLLHTAASLDIIPPLLLLALLSTRVVPRRELHPVAYRLYMELIKQNVFMLESHIYYSNYAMIMESIDNVLQLSQVYNQKVCEPGVVLVEFVFSILWQLLEASLDDEGLLDHVPENKPIWLSRSHDMDVDEPDCINEMKTKQKEGLQRENTTMAIEIIVEFLQNKMTSRLLSLVHRNMPPYWGSFNHQMQLLASKSSILRNLKHINADTLVSLMENIHGVVSHCNTKSKLQSNVVIPAGSPISFAGHSYESSWSSFWLPIDLILEDALDGGHVAAFSAIEIITGLVKILHAINGTTWHNTFLGLWIAALRLVQRERDSNEGPVPRCDTCMCMLLSITTHVVANIIEEEESELIEKAECGPTNQGKNKQVLGKRRGELITSLQLLGDFQFLLAPPQAVLKEANQAAAKAIVLVSGNPVGSGNSESLSMDDLPMNCSGNLRHLIVEACIARNLLDTSAYFWPGYVNACSNQITSSISNHVDGWSSLMKGSQLTPGLVDVLAATPASSLAEIEKIYEIAIDGSDEEKISAATILCGASLVRGWNVQEHTIIFITKLLSPICLPNHTGTDNHLISQAPFLNVLLVGISSVDCVHYFSLHGLVPLLAAGLMQICEVFGSCDPDVSWTVTTTGEKLSHREVFSNAFTLLLRFWRFDHLPSEQVRVNAATPPLGSLFSPEYLLLVRNCKVASIGRSAKDSLKLKRLSKIIHFPKEPVFMDSFPKLNFWYRQHQQCIASIHSGLVPGGPVHQIVDALLCMMFRKVNDGSEPSTPTTLGSHSSSGSGSALDDALMKLKVPAWDILEAIPFVLDASLNACAYGRVSTRELATGLKDLADFIPASLVAIASYFSAEVTRGIWKPASMNGTDWPSPAANLSLVEQQIKNILAATGVDVPSLAVDGDSPATIPLPLAAFVSLSITYKLEKGKERFLVLIGPALSAVASGCPWPCMPILTSLWIQKVQRWSDYFLLSASGTVFHHNKDAVVQLLKSCFTSTLGLGSTCMITNNGGVGALLGHGLASQDAGGISPVAPGVLYLRVYRSIGDIMFLNKEIMSILMLSVRDITSCELPKGNARKQLKKFKYGMKCGEVSFVRYMARVKHAALLGASLVWISGGQKLVQSLIRDTVPSWFLSADMFEQDGGESGALVAILSGYALAFFVMLSVAFAWGIDHCSVSPNQRAEVIWLHLEFLTSTLERNTSPCCHHATWRAYVSGFVGLMVGCTPMWVQEVDVELLKRLSKGLRQLNDELALQLLEIGGIGAMGAAAETIIKFEHML